MTQRETQQQLVDAAARLETLSKELPSKVTEMESIRAAPQELLTKLADIEKELRVLSHMEKQLIDASLLLTGLPRMRAKIETIMRQNKEIAAMVPLISEINTMCKDLASRNQKSLVPQRPKRQMIISQNWAAAIAVGILVVMGLLSHLGCRSINEKLLAIETSIAISPSQAELERVSNENRELKTFRSRLKTELEKLPRDQRRLIMDALHLQIEPRG